MNTVINTHVQLCIPRGSSADLNACKACGMKRSGMSTSEEQRSSDGLERKHVRHGRGGLDIRKKDDGRRMLRMELSGKRKRRRPRRTYAEDAAGDRNEWRWLWPLTREAERRRRRYLVEEANTRCRGGREWPGSLKPFLTTHEEGMGQRLVSVWGQWQDAGSTPAVG